VEQTFCSTLGEVSRENLLTRNKIEAAKTANVRKETDSLEIVQVPEEKLWGAQTQRSIEHFSIGQNLIPHEMIPAYAILKKAAAIAGGLLLGLTLLGVCLPTDSAGKVAPLWQDVIAAGVAVAAYSVFFRLRR
jgi:hypothetical protein